MKKKQKILISASEIAEKTSELAKQISKDYQGKEIFMVVLLRGSFIFAADLIRKIEPDVIVDFMVVSSYHGEKSTGEVRIIKDLSQSIHGREVLIVEDIVDTGLTLTKILDLLGSRTPGSMEVCTLLSKPSRREKEVDVKYCGFEIEDKFVVGYGLDVDQKYRQLPDIVELID